MGKKDSCKEPVYNVKWNSLTITVLLAILYAQDGTTTPWEHHIAAGSKYPEPNTFEK
jgi:hypothetical protein